MKFGFLAGLLFSLQVSALENYTQACRVIGEDDYVQYQIEAETPLRTGSQFNLKLTAFEDENCTIPYLHYNQYFSVEGLQGENLNLKTVKVTYTTLSDEVSDALNMIQYCGLKDWKTNSETGVTGQVCDDFPQLKYEQTFFQLFKQDHNALWIGLISPQKDGRDESQRPVNWDELGFTKVLSKPSLHINRVHLE
jgi:hypothetical protein